MDALVQSGKALSPLSTSIALLSAFVLYRIWVYATATRTTRLRGPKSPSWLWGFDRATFRGGDVLHEEWHQKNGMVYSVPGSIFSGTKVVLLDPKALAHFYSLETYTYLHTPFAKHIIGALFGRGILYVEGDAHKMQRRILSPAFSNQAIRDLTPIFFDSALQAAWDAIIEASHTDEVVIDVQNWMNRISFDTIGIAGFSHDFHTLAGARSKIADLFEGLGQMKPSIVFIATVLLSPVFPWLLKLPHKRNEHTLLLRQNMSEIADEIMKESKSAGEGDEKSKSRSIIGALVQAQSTESAQSRLSHEEVVAQMNTLLVAGYETTSISLTWALIELSLQPELQTKLREELRQLNDDPTYEQLMNSLPYLDGVVRETLRLHPPVVGFGRSCVKDDIIPLSEPITLPSGEQTDRITVAAGTTMSIPIKAIQRSRAIWGEHAHAFVPERWIGEQGLTKRARELQGWGHLLTFIDGPRICLGRAFAVAEFKAVLAILIRHYTFAPRDGPTMKLDQGFTLLPRPKLEGEETCKLPLRVRRVE